MPPYVRVVISVSGYTQKEITEGLPDLREEFEARPWLLNPSATWDSQAACLRVEMGYEGDNLNIQGGDVGAVLDEVSDCVIACIHFSSDKISFKVDSAYVVDKE